MKTIKLLSLLALAFLLSCNSDLEQPSKTEDITISVSTPSSAISRADGQTGVEGYKLVCLMQLLDGNGSKVGEQASSELTNGKFSFTVKGTDRDAGASKAIFWAEYQPTVSGKEKVYNSSDLQAVKYLKTKFDLSDPSANASMEAFSGEMADITTGEAVLKRPVAKYFFTPSGKENAKEVTSLSVKFDTYSAYNVGSKEAPSVQSIVLENLSFDADQDSWFEVFMLCPVNQAYAPSDMTVEFGDRKVVIPKDKLPATANYQYNIKAKIGKSDVNIDVTIDDSWDQNEDKGGSDPVDDPGKNDGKDPGNDKDPAKNPTQGDTNYTIGSLIDANGFITTDESKAMAVYILDGADLNESIDLYPGFSGKSIKGYAISLENISETALTATLTSAEKLELANGGYQNTSKLLQYLSGSEFLSKYNSWVDSHKINNENFSSWFIPLFSQGEKIYPNAFNMGVLSAEDFNSKNFITPYVTEKLKYQEIKMSVSEGKLTVSHYDYYASDRVYCRPIMAIFKY